MHSGILMKETELPVFDEKIAADLYSIIEDGIVELIDIFIKETPEQVSRLQDISCAREELELVSHTLKSTSAYFGLVRLSQACQLLENTLRNGQSDNIEAIVNTINSEFAPALNALKEYLRLITKNHD